jgi:hypothetical protein
MLVHSMHPPTWGVWGRRPELVLNLFTISASDFGETAQCVNAVTSARYSPKRNRQSASTCERRTPCAVFSHQYTCADRANPSRRVLLSSSASGVETESADFLNRRARFSELDTVTDRLESCRRAVPAGRRLTMRRVLDDETEADDRAARRQNARWSHLFRTGFTFHSRFTLRRSSPQLRCLAVS